mgnify:CR=1 FL=1
MEDSFVTLHSALQINEIKKVKAKKLLIGAAVGAGPQELKRAEAILKEKVDLIVGYLW